MLRISLDNLDECLKEIENLFGSDFLDQEHVHAAGGHIPFVEDTHPLRNWWNTLKMDVLTSKQASQLRLSEKSIRMLNLFANLQALASVPGFGRILRTLKQKDLFFSSAFEANVAASYRNAGMQVEIVEESRVSGTKTSDLYIYANGKPVFVECKSLDDLTREESRLWEQLIGRLCNALRKYRRCWVCSVYAKSRIDGRLMEDVCLQVIEDIRLGNLVTRTIGTTVRVECSELCEWGIEKPWPLVLSNSEQFSLGLVDAEVRLLENGLGVYRNPKIVRVSPFEETDISRRLLAEVKRAREQIPEQGPGIVHVEIPAAVGPKLLNLVDNSWETVFHALNQDTRRINAVVLTGTTIHSGYIWQNYYVIPNLEPRSELPPGFLLLGVNDWLPSEAITESEVTVEFWVTVPQSWQPCLPLELFFWASRDGKKQLHLWRTWDGTPRFDVFMPRLGRAIVLGSEEIIEPGGIYYFAGTWSEKNRQACLYMNGCKIGQTQLG